MSKKQQALGRNLSSFQQLPAAGVKDKEESVVQPDQASLEEMLATAQNHAFEHFKEMSSAKADLEVAKADNARLVSKLKEKQAEIVKLEDHVLTWRTSSERQRAELLAIQDREREEEEAIDREAKATVGFNEAQQKAMRHFAILMGLGMVLGALCMYLVLRS